jgi:hypothetical protein
MTDHETRRQQQGRKIFLFGAGPTGAKALGVLRTQALILGFLDNDARKWGTVHEGFVVRAPNEALTHDDSEIWITCGAWKLVNEQLLRMGVDSDRIRVWSKDVRFEGDFPWTKSFPDEEKLTALDQWQRAQRNFFDKVETVFDRGNWIRRIHPGYRSKIRRIADLYKGRRCFVIGNGPSIRRMDISRLQNEITIGSNGVFRMFSEWGFSTTFYTMEDVAQVEDRRSELPSVKGSIRLFGLDNSYCISEREDTLFVNLCRYSHPFDSHWKRYYPDFSKDLSVCAYLGSTVTYLNLQLAFYLGCDPVYLIGVDHDYGDLPKIFPPGKIEITEEVLEKLKSIHFDSNYHKLGGRIGVPYVKEQESAFRQARMVFEEDGRSIFNAGIDSKLDVFERKQYSELFQ